MARQARPAAQAADAYPAGQGSFLPSRRTCSCRAAPARSLCLAAGQRALGAGSPRPPPRRPPDPGAAERAAASALRVPGAPVPGRRPRPEPSRPAPCAAGQSCRALWIPSSLPFQPARPPPPPLSSREAGAVPPGALKPPLISCARLHSLAGPGRDPVHGQDAASRVRTRRACRSPPPRPRPPARPRLPACLPACPLPGAAVRHVQWIYWARGEGARRR